MYELHNLSALRCFIQDNLEPGEEFLCTLNGDFLSPSLLSSLDLGAAAVSAMNAVPVTHACLGNHEFDHSIEVLGQRLAELDCDVVNTNVFACPPGEEDASAAAASAALASETSVPHPELSVGRRESDGEADGDDGATGAFLDRLPRSRVVTVGNVTVGLVGVCTTSTPLSSARKPRGVVFAEAVPVAREHARRVAPLCDAVVALTHQTLPEDARLAEEVPEIAVILGGHEHTPFAGRMGHGANAAAANGPIGADTECVNHLAGTLCVKAGMDAENVVVVVVEAPGADPSSTIGADRGGECTEEAAAAAAAAAAAGKDRDDFGEGGLWRNNVVADPGSAPAERTTTTTDDRPTCPDPTPSPTNVALNHGHAHDLHVALRVRRAGRRDWHRGDGSPAGLRRRRLGADVLAQGVQDGPGNRRGHLATQRGAQGAESAHAQPPRARGEAGFDAVIVQGRARRAVLARHPLRHHPQGRVPRGRVPVQQRRHTG